MSQPPRSINVVTGPLGSQGMIAPSDTFVEPDGTLQPVSFRFLWGLYQAVATLQTQVATLQQRLTAAGL